MWFWLIGMGILSEFCPIGFPSIEIDKDRVCACSSLAYDFDYSVAQARFVDQDVHRGQRDRARRIQQSVKRCIVEQSPSMLQLSMVSGRGFPRRISARSRPRNSVGAPFSNLKVGLYIRVSLWLLGKLKEASSRRDLTWDNKDWATVMAHTGC